MSRLASAAPAVTTNTAPKTHHDCAIDPDRGRHADAAQKCEPVQLLPRAHPSTSSALEFTLSIDHDGRSTAPPGPATFPGAGSGLGPELLRPPSGTPGRPFQVGDGRQHRGQRPVGRQFSGPPAEFGGHVLPPGRLVPVGGVAIGTDASAVRDPVRQPSWNRRQLVANARRSWLTRPS